jgi:hypothetical protein
MAKGNDIDRLFQEKLTGHSVQPSAVAWDKLEARLSQKKRAPVLWIRIAAAILLIGGLSALIWLGVENTRQELDHLADQEPVQERSVRESHRLPEAAPPLQVEEAPENEEVPQPVAPSGPVRRIAPANTVKPVLATLPSEESKPVAKENIPLPEWTALDLPPLDQKLLAAESDLVDLEGEEAKEVAYKVTIISNGLREKPEKEGLVGEIEEKIDKIGSLIGKVDQGFADLQDAKNNLFASITTRK